jgi:Asp-tRNA(Asn)/Glu-tRNA(Gln) amidotransferase A subunit family amidase
VALCDLTAHALSAKLGAGEISAVELTESSLDRIGRVDQDVNAFITVTDAPAPGGTR